MTVSKITRRVKNLIPGSERVIKTTKELFLNKRKQARPGASPGMIVVPEGAMQTKGYMFRYTKDKIEEFEITPSTDLKLLAPNGNQERVWINLTGLQDMDWIKRVGEFFMMSPLTLEDVFETNHRVKIEHQEDRVFLVSRMVDGYKKVPNEKVSFFLADRVLITFDERPGDIFEPVRQRLRGGHGRIRISSCDYLLYTLLDTIIDHYLLLIEQFDDEAEMLEQSIVLKPTQENFRCLHELKISVRHLERQFRPHRAIVEELISKSDIPGSLIEPDTKIFFKDCLDHTMIALDDFDRLHDELSSLMDLYHSIVSNKLNETMKVLTMISALFMPLAFITGLYGMNFNTELSPYNMPELDFYFGYPMALLMMLCASSGLLFYFRRQGWF